VGEERFGERVVITDGGTAERRLQSDDDLLFPHLRAINGLPRSSLADSMAKSNLTAHAIADTPAATLEKRARKIIEHLEAIEELMVDGVELSDEERRTALRLQGPDEVAALAGVIDYAEARPELFKTLAAADDGQDPAVFETALLRARLGNAALLGKLTERIDQTRAMIADSALYVATLVKRPALTAYEIAKPHHARDREHGKHLNAALNLFRARALAGAKTRQKAKTV
jgi:hypothetical protein